MSIADLSVIQTWFPMLRGHETIFLRYRGSSLQVTGSARSGSKLQNGGGPGNSRG